MPSMFVIEGRARGYKGRWLPLEGSPSAKRDRDNAVKAADWANDKYPEWEHRVREYVRK